MDCERAMRRSFSGNVLFAVAERDADEFLERFKVAAHNGRSREPSTDSEAPVGGGSPAPLAFGGQPAFLDRQHRSSTDEIPPASVKLRAIRVKTSSLPLRPPRPCARRLPSAASFPSCAWARNCLRNCASSPSKKSAKSVVQKNLPTPRLSVSTLKFPSRSLNRFSAFSFVRLP